MKQLTFLAQTILRHRIDELGLHSFIAKICPLALLNIVVIGLVFTTARNDQMNIEFFSLQYVYFIPLFALLAGLTSFEAELFSGLSYSCILSYRRILFSRVLLIITETLVPFVAFCSLLVLAGSALQHLLLASVLLLAFSGLGVGLALVFGLRHEKSINNLSHLSTWVLALGPGPFFGLQVQGFHKWFPGGHALAGQWKIEAAKIAFVFLVGGLLILWGKRPRRLPLH